jgi:anti-sigma factor NepR-like protein
MRSTRDPDDPEPERRDTGPSFYERAIRTGIGRGLRRYYDLSEQIPDRMLKLLDQLDGQSKPAAAEPKAESKAEPTADATEPGTQ